MSILVLGGSGATGRLVVSQLLARDISVTVIIRLNSQLPSSIKNHPQLTVIRANLLEIPDTTLLQHLRDCNAVVSCLGHHLSFKGIYGQPRRLVTDAIKRIYQAANNIQPDQPIKFILMNTTGNHHPDNDRPVSFKHRCVIALLRLLLPPHCDNEQAAAFLRTEIGQQHPSIQWIAVRPDNLIDETAVSKYEIHPSPTRDAIFDAGKTSRINVAHFMAVLLTDTKLWQQWQGKMPVIYNASEQTPA